ncbi:hypothetical protein Tco_1239146, partial [Tanacetum coccineum]
KRGSSYIPSVGDFSVIDDHLGLVGYAVNSLGDV